MATPAIEGNHGAAGAEGAGRLRPDVGRPRWLTFATQVRFSGEQFDDDLNAFVLGAYGVWDAQVSRGLTRGLTAFVADGEHLRQGIRHGRTPMRNIGWPRTLRVGVRLAWQ